MDLKEEDILGADIGRHWYYRSKAAALRRMVGGLGPRRILDVGAGSGFFSRHLLAEAGAQSALCVDIGYAERSRRQRRRQAGALPPRHRADRLRPRADDGRAGARRRRSRPRPPLRRQGAGRRAFPGDGARLPLPVERPRRLPRAQAALSAGRDRGGDARRRPAGRARRLLFRLRLSPRRGRAARHARRDRAQEQPEEARCAHQRHPDARCARPSCRSFRSTGWRDCRPSCWRGSPERRTTVH